MNRLVGKSCLVAVGISVVLLSASAAHAQRVGGGGCQRSSGGMPGMPREASSLISLVPMTGMNYQRETARTYQAQLEQSYRWQLALSQQQSLQREEQAALEAREAKRRDRVQRLSEQREAEKAQREAASLQRRARSAALASND